MAEMGKMATAMIAVVKMNTIMLAGNDHNNHDHCTGRNEWLCTPVAMNGHNESGL